MSQTEETKENVTNVASYGFADARGDTLCWLGKDRAIIRVLKVERAAPIARKVYGPVGTYMDGSEQVV